MPPRQRPDKTLINRTDFAGIPLISKEEARACAVRMSGTSLQLGATPVELGEVLDALGLKDFLRESS